MSIGKLRFHFTPSIAIPGWMPLVAVWLVLLLAPALINAQTTVFTDDFNRSTFGTTGGSPEMTWTKTGTAAISMAQVSGSNYQLTFDNGATTGRSSISGPLSIFSTPFLTSLSSNKDDIIWTFNIRTARTAASVGFQAGNGQYGFAVVLAGTNSDFNSTSTTENVGYAVTLTQGSVSTSYNAIRLTKFTGGFNPNTRVTTIIGPSQDAVLTNYFSVKVVYSPVSNLWKLYVRDDGTTPSVDPNTGNLTFVGSATDDTYTNREMSYGGFFMSHGTTSTPNSNKVNYDNFKVVVDNRLFTPAADITWSTPNWGQGTLTPGSNYDVRIPSNRKVTNTGTAASKMLHLESASPTEGSQLINDGGTLTVTDKIKVKVTLSDANAWRFVGFPFAVSKVYKADGSTEAVAGIDYQIATYNADTRANGQSGWEAVTQVNTTNPLVAGKGYIVASAADLFFETASTPATTAFGASNDVALSFTTVTGAANHHGWNFIVSPVVANAFLTLAEGQFRYVYNGTSYEVDDTSDGTLTEYPFRAFFVKTAAAADKTFTTSNPSPAPALKSSGGIGKATFYLNDGTSEYSTKIRINELSTEMYDPAYDAEHLFPFSTAIPQIYTRMDGKNLAINSVPAGTTIPLYLRIPQAGNFTLRWNQQTDEALSLYDATTNTTVQLDAATEYNFTVNETGTLSNRFSIRTGTDVTTAQTNTLSKSIKLHVDGKLLHISGVESEAKMQLLDIAGRQLVNQLLVDRFEYTLPHAGVYIVRIVSDKGNKEYKVIVR